MDLSWTTLPKDVTDLILAHLSSADAARARAVCRSWHAAISSPSFSVLREQVQGHREGPHPASLLLYNHSLKISAACEWPACDPDSGAPIVSWADINVPFRFVREWVGHPRSGFVCVRTHLATSLQQFFVGSPLSATNGASQWVPIPNPPPTPSASLSKLWAIISSTSSHTTSCPNSPQISSSHRFWVVLLHLHAQVVSLNIFDSESGTWQMMPVPVSTQCPAEVVPALAPPQLLSFSSRADCIGDILYSIQPEARSITTFDVQRKAWKHLPYALPQDLLFQAKIDDRFLETPPKLIQGWKNSVLLVGTATCSNPDHHDRTMAEPGDVGTVWELITSAPDVHGSVGPWRKLSRCPLPATMCDMLLQEAAECRMKGGDIMPIRYTGYGDFVLVMASGASCGIRLDVTREVWTWVDMPAGINCELALCFQPK